MAEVLLIPLLNVPKKILSIKLQSNIHLVSSITFIYDLKKSFVILRFDTNATIFVICLRAKMHTNGTKNRGLTALAITKKVLF